MDRSKVMDAGIKNVAGDTVIITADRLGVSVPAVAMWHRRYDDFPAMLLELSGKPVWSMAQVLDWHDTRVWKPGKHRG